MTVEEKDKVASANNVDAFEVVMDDEHDVVIDADEIMRKYDKESNVRIWEGKPKYVVMAVEIFFAAFCIYVTLFATWLDQIRLTSFVALIIVMGYLNYPMKKGNQKTNSMPWYDFVIMIAGAGSFLYFCFGASSIIMRLPTITWFEVIIGIVGILALMELCRRSVGIPILCVAGFFILYALYYFIFQKQLGIDAIQTLVYRLFYTTTGVLSTPINVCSKFIVVFIVFGAFLERTGISQFFINVANSFAGWADGGPAKVAVISSALCGMVSGSSVGNTVTTGSVTIPMMKDNGYRPEFAGAVEAASSTGGQIMPPIMGAAAFLMADYIGVPYSQIILCAILPAVLYFTGIFICVHLEAKKTGLKGLSRDMLPRFKHLVKRTYLLLPLIILVYLVSSNTKTMAFSAAVAILFAIAVANLHKSPIVGGIGCLALLIFVLAPVTGILSIAILIVGVVCSIFCMFLKEATLSPAKFADAMASGARGCIAVGAACGMAGIIAGSITMTGLASKLITGIISLTNNITVITVFFALLIAVGVFFVVFAAIGSKMNRKTALIISIAAAVATIALIVATNGVYTVAMAAGIEWKTCRLFLALFLTMLCCIVLGMGVPTTANYCIMASTCAPILIQMGVPALSAHFFVFYFGIVADITPPVALAAYAGSAIAKSPPMKTAFNALRLAIAAFIVPYIFAMDPTLLLIGATPFDVVVNSVTAVLGILGVAAGLQGYFVRYCGLPFRILCVVGGLCMLIPGALTDMVGLAALAFVVAVQIIENKRDKHHAIA